MSREKQWQKNGGFLGLLLGLAFGFVINLDKYYANPAYVLGFTTFTTLVGAIIGATIGYLLGKLSKKD